jgi:hypothetical protein
MDVFQVRSTEPLKIAASIFFVKKNPSTGLTAKVRVVIDYTKKKKYLANRLKGSDGVLEVADMEDWHN